MVEDVTLSLDNLQLSAFPSAKLKVDELFLLFLSSPEGAIAVSQCLEATMEGSSIEGILSSSVGGVSAGNSSWHFSKSTIGASSSGAGGQPCLSVHLQGSEEDVGGDFGTGLQGGGYQSSVGGRGGSGSGGSIGVGGHAGYESGGPPRSPTKKSEKSPKKRTQSEMLASRTSSLVISDQKKLTDSSGSLLNYAAAGSSEDGDPEKETHIVARRRANFDSIPVFYVPGKKGRKHLGSARIQLNEDQPSKRLAEIEEFFAGFPGGVPTEKFVHITKRYCGIPSFFNVPLVNRINELFGEHDRDKSRKGVFGRHASSSSSSASSLQHEAAASEQTVQLKAFWNFWYAEIEPYDRVERFFRVIKQTDSDTITKDDFVPFMQELLKFHPGLDFLVQHDEFQRKYALTVITRIFYSVNTSQTGRLSLREVMQSNLFNAFMHADEENDINRVLDYFSYEHFYVLYCRFFELDTDKDTKLTRDDLIRYSEHALSDFIVDRVFQVGLRVFSDGKVGGFKSTGMSYSDFIFFMLAEEDKTSEVALRYWFACCDLDGDGTLSPEELRHFYRAQLHRVTSLGQEAIPFQDVFCQLVDLLAPKDPRAITIEDLIRPERRQVAGLLFDVLFNLHKFMHFETRDPFQEKLRREDGFACDWDRFANLEYHRLAQEDGAGSNFDSTMDVDEHTARMQQQQLLLQQQQQQQHLYAMGGGTREEWSLDDSDFEGEEYEVRTHTHTCISCVHLP